MVDMVVGNQIVDRRTVGVAPYPSYRNTRIAQVGYLVMGDAVVCGVKQGDTHGRGMHITAMVDDAIVYFVAACNFLAFFRQYITAYLDTAGT